MKNLIVLLLPLFGWAQTPIYGTFSPQPRQKYVVSCWVSEVSEEQQFQFSHSLLTVTFVNSGANPLTFSPSGNIIDGWQRISGIVEAPENSTAIVIEVINTPQTPLYVDDIRCVPFNGTIKSYAYDAETMKLMAELDENNYATFYEYDQEGGLTRVKKETEKGVLTVKEARSNNTKLQFE